MEDYRREQRSWDWRFFRVVETAAALGSRKGLIPGAVFESLRNVGYGPDLDNMDDDAVADTFRAALETASGASRRSR